VKAVGVDKDDADEASNALGLAYLNSHFESSFVNPLDTAILASAPKPPDLKSYRKLAELPYDFNRRMLSVVVQRGTEPPMLVTKGAPEAVAAVSTNVREDHTARPIHKAEHEAGEAGQRLLGRRIPPGRGRLEGPDAGRDGRRHQSRF
jgi:Mg2+-importing ATPase